MGADVPGRPERGEIEIPSRKDVLDALMRSRELVPPTLSVGKASALYSRHPGLEKVGVDEAREFIDAMMSLIMPDKATTTDLFNVEEGRLEKMVQEDIILNELVDYAMKMGIFEEYEPIFLSLVQYRKMQFTFLTHMGEPGDVDNPQNLLACALKIKRDKGEPASLASVGCGDALPDQALSVLGLIEQATSLEVSGEHDRDGYSKVNDHVTFLRITSQERTEEEVRSQIFRCTGNKDIYFFGDSLHHTPDPHQYISEAWKRLNPGGYLVISEPFRFRSDYITEQVLNPLDSTEHHESMQTNEEHEAWINELIGRGGNVVSAKMMFGSEAGLNDVYHRVFVIVQKPEELDSTDSEPEKWRFIDNCPEFRSFLNPIYRNGEAPVPSLNFPDDLPESEFTEIARQVIDMVHGVVKVPFPSPIAERYLTRERWDAHIAQNFLDNYVFAILTDNIDQMMQLRPASNRVIKEKGEKARELFQGLFATLQKVRELNSQEDISDYFKHTTGVRLTEKGSAPMTTGENSFLQEFMNLAHARKPSGVIKVLMEVRANDLIMSIVETHTPERAREIIREDVLPILELIANFIPEPPYSYEKKKVAAQA